MTRPEIEPRSPWPFARTEYWIFNTKYNRLIGLVGREFASDLEDLGSISGPVLPKNLKVVLDTSLLNTQQYKVRIKGKVEQRSTLLYTSM